MFIWVVIEHHFFYTATATALAIALSVDPMALQWRLEFYVQIITVAVLFVTLVGEVKMGFNEKDVFSKNYQLLPDKLQPIKWNRMGLSSSHTQCLITSADVVLMLMAVLPCFELQNNIFLFEISFQYFQFVNRKQNVEYNGNAIERNAKAKDHNIKPYTYWKIDDWCQILSISIKNNQMMPLVILCCLN